MAAVRQKNGGPELIVRRLLHAKGYRFRVHRKDLPGTPDIVFPSRRRVVFVHGCFWHGHGCRKGQLPKAPGEFWSRKIARNRERDAENIAALQSLGWASLTVWQCELRDTGKLVAELTEFLDSISAASDEDAPRYPEPE